MQRRKFMNEWLVSTLVATSVPIKYSTVTRTDSSPFHSSARLPPAQVRRQELASRGAVLSALIPQGLENSSGPRVIVTHDLLLAGPRTPFLVGCRPPGVAFVMLVVVSGRSRRMFGGCSHNNKDSAAVGRCLTVSDEMAIPQSCFVALVCLLLFAHVAADCANGLVYEDAGVCECFTCWTGEGTSSLQSSAANANVQYRLLDPHRGLCSVVRNK